MSDRTFTRRVLASRIARYVDDALAHRVPETFDSLALDIHLSQMFDDGRLDIARHGGSVGWDAAQAASAARPNSGGAPSASQNTADGRVG